MLQMRQATYSELYKLEEKATSYRFTFVGFFRIFFVNFSVQHTF